MGHELYTCTIEHTKYSLNLSHTQGQHRNNDIDLTQLDIFKEGA